MLNNKKIIIAIGIAAAIIVLWVIYLARSPVLIVTENSFVSFYGEQRLKNESFRISISLFRAVKPVIVANDAGEDIVPYAIAQVSKRPFCVLFPQRFSRSARMYRDQNPNIPVVLLTGRRSPAENQPDFLVFGTDMEDDFYRAGAAAGAISRGKEGNIAILIDPRLYSTHGTQLREAFVRGVEEQESLAEPLFISSLAAEYSGESPFLCVVLAGTGSDYLERKAEIPVIFFSWLDPLLAPRDVVLLVDDSPWAQAKQAVRMVSGGENQGFLRSNFIVLGGKNIDRGILRRIKKSV